MDQEELQNLYDEKYENIFGISFQKWMDTKAPQTEDQAYARCEEIDRQLKDSYDEWYEAEGENKDQLEERRDKLKAEYDLLEEMFHLELEDR